MHDHAVELPRFPRLPALALRGLPLAPLSLTLSAFARRMATRHPSMFRRLGEHATARFVLDPTDLPICMALAPAEGRPRVQLSRAPLEGDARIAGPAGRAAGHGARRL